MEHILHTQPEGYHEPHKEIGSQSPSRPSPLLGPETSTFQLHVLHAIPLCQLPQMKKNKRKTKYAKKNLIAATVY